MRVSNTIHAVFFLLSIVSLKLCYCLQSKTIVCLDIEKQSLLRFKKSLNDSFNQLSSWNDEVNCCKWNGVVCNNSTGHVHELNLQGCRLHGKVNPSLINLKHLTHLDLSYNFFERETIPSFIGSLTQLEYLDLSYAGFGGKIPYNIGNLSNLHALILDYDLPGGLYVDSLEWLSGLSKLEYLNMNGVDLSRATNWAKVINSLSSLLEIYCSFCSLDFTSPLNVVNLTSLTHLDFSNNYNIYISQPVPFPIWFFKLENLLYLRLAGMIDYIGPLPTVSNATKLQYIDLSDNNLNSSIPDWRYLCKDLEIVSLSSSYLKDEISNAIANLSSLEVLDLSWNTLSGKIPREITNICTIRALVLSSNELHGDVHDSFGNMSACFLGSLEQLDLYRNRLSGHLTEQFGKFRSLVWLDLSNNSFSSVFPISLVNLSHLEYLRLGHNNFTGNLPEGLGHLSELVEFNIENNKLEGIVTQNHFVNLSKLTSFFASGNHLSLNVGPNWVPPVQLRGLALGSWRLGVESELPSWLETQRNITYLDISNAGISGSIPHWFFDIVYLNASHNNLHGSIPPIILFGRSLYLSANKLSGSLPRLGVQVADFDVSYNLLSKGISNLICGMENDTTYFLSTERLYLLNLEGNLLSGELPNCWDKWPNLKTLNLANNTFSGNIPNSIGFLPDLEYLSLHHNKFSGQIPSAIHNCTNLLKIDLSHNNLDGNLPLLMGTSLVKLKFLILRSNRLRGEISPNICHLQSLQVLDLSSNMFFGIIPSCVSNFTAMATKRSLSLESYAIISYPPSASGSTNTPFDSASVITKGSELEYSTTLSLVAAIDLSSNNLSGEIPKELTSLVDLRSLNLSQNHLTGSIPEKIGDMKELESLDFSRNFLSGQVPKSLARISSLSYLNLSFNKLTGKIPEGSQLQTLDASSFIGNDLCGAPLNNCSHGGNEARPQKVEKGEKSEIKWLYVLLSLGYAVGFSAACSALVLKKSWRDAYFGLLECAWDNIYVHWHIKWARLTNSAASIWQTIKA